MSSAERIPRGGQEQFAPEIQGAENSGRYEVPYVVMGDSDSAQHLIFESAPYFTPIAKPHYQLRLQAHQEALGDDFCVVGVDSFSSRAHTFAREQLKQFKDGDFSPLSERVFRTVESVSPSEDQTVSVGGYSLGADISIQAAYDASRNDSRGIVGLIGLKAFEPARVDEGRSFMQAAKAFADSGKDWYKNVAASDSKELLEAFDIDGLDPKKAEKRLNNQAGISMLGYLAASPLANKALIQGFATDESLKQLNLTLSSGEVPAVLGGISSGSSVSSGIINRLIDVWDYRFSGEGEAGVDYRFETIDGDHSADDNIRESAQRQARFGEMIVAATA